MPNGNLQLDILGASFSISTDEDPAYLEELFNFYKEAVKNTQRITKLKDPLQTAILTGFLLCDELKKRERTPVPATPVRAGEDGAAAEKLTLDLIARMDRALDHEKAPEYRILKLVNQVKHYDWGSPDGIPALLGADNAEGRPWAELWMGVHPGGPSEVTDRGMRFSLRNLIGADPRRYLGGEVYETFGALPFLFKVLAAGKPLSIQAHPNREQARQGFDRENREGIAIDAPGRNYKDPNHKPEILCALSPFTALCGFRPPGDIRRGLTRFLSGASPSLRGGLSPLMDALAGAGPAGTAVSWALRDFLSALFALPAGTRQELTGYILQNRETRAAGATAAGTAETNAGVDTAGETAADAYMAAFAELYPGDPAIIAPLYLNLLKLRPGEAVYLDAGVLHAYIEGFGVELMANSDNVLRGGLSPKHIDVPELMRVLDFSPRRPGILKAADPAPAWYAYPAPCKEFSLSVMNSRGEEGLYPVRGPSILAVTGGEARFIAGEKTARLLPGESVFIPAGKPGEAPRYSGSFTAYAAALPAAETGGKDTP
jgi:mannose-6-phosphate isomerase